MSLPPANMLYLEDYLYTYENDGINPARWNCSKRKSDACPVFLVTKPLEDDEQSEEILEVVGLHTHGKDNKIALKSERKKTPSKNTAARSTVQRELQTTTTATGTVTPKATSGAGTTPRNEEFEHNHVYLLVTNNGREIVCVNGYMYRLEGKSKTSATFRWECIRSDVGCKTRIYTERIDENQHVLRQTHLPAIHDEHEPYTPRHLSKLISKHKMQLVDDGSARTWLKVEAKSPTKSSPSSSAGGTRGAKGVGGVNTKKSHALRIPDYSMSVPKSDPLLPSKEVIISKSVFGKKNFTIMPSAKGNRVLCVDNMIFNYDQASPCANRSYWTCLMRRDKRYKCKARLVMEESKEGLQIRKMSGSHNHPDHSAKIDRRLKSLGLRREDIDNANIREIRKEQQAPSSANLTPMPNIGMITRQLAAENLHNSADDDDDGDNDNDDYSISSDACASPTPQKLPERLEEMRKNEQILTEDGLVTVECIDFSAAQSGDLYEPEITEQLPEDPPSEEHVIATTSSGGCGGEAIVVSTSAPGRRSGRKRKHSEDGVNWGKTEYEMDISKVSRLRSAKGHFLLCVDDYIYYMKRESGHKNHWVCIKNRDREINCKSFLTTASKGDSAAIEVTWVTNGHNHPVCEHDIKRRLCNELIASGAVPRKSFQFNDYFNRSLDEVKKECAEILSDFQAKLASDGKVFKGEGRKMKLYAVSDGPPSLAVRMTLKALNIPYELKNVDYVAAEHMTEEYAKMNPQKEIPVLDDDGFYLPESIAIMQYLCDKYAPESDLYPKDAKTRALVNHRLCFNMGFYYASISVHSMAPIFFDYPRNEMTLKKVKNALDVFETYLIRNGTKYAAAEHVTLADFALVAATICLEGIDFDLTPWRLVKKWYETFKSENPALWEIANGGMQEIAAFNKNPPDLSHMNHPFHPTKKPKE